MASRAESSGQVETLEPTSKPLRSFKDLIVWQKSYRLVLEIHKLTKDFPKSEVYGLAQQMRKAAISIPSNIAEGYGRNHRTEYHRFLSIAYGSLSELETQYLLSVDLACAKRDVATEALLTEVGSMLYRMLHPKPKTYSVPQ